MRQINPLDKPVPTVRQTCFGTHPDKIHPECLLCAAESDCIEVTESRPECFGTHPDGIVAECLLCAKEVDCEAVTAESKLPEDPHSFVCPRCGRRDTLEEYTANGEIRTPLSVDENGELTAGDPRFDSWEPWVSTLQ